MAWKGLGWEAAWLSEIEPFPKEVLRHRHPDVPDLGDMMTIVDKILSQKIEAPDVLVGGTPCQSFSVAGLRQSLDDERGNLALEYVRIADAIDHVRSFRGLPGAVTVWENVPGVLNTKDNAFGCLLGAIAGEDVPLEPPRGRWKNAGFVLGPKRAVAWRCLDAQYFGLAQRRKRVFVVSGPRDGFRPQEILFEFEGERRDTAPGREKGQSTTAPAQVSPGAGGADGGVSTYDMRGNGDGNIVNPLVGDHASRPTDYTPVVLKPEPARDTAATLTARYPGSSHQWAPHNEADNLIPVKSVLPFDTTQVTSPLNYSKPKEGDPCHPLAAGAHPPAIVVGSETGAPIVDVVALQDVRARDKAQNGRGWNDEGVSYTVDAAATQGVAFGCDLSQKAEGVGFKPEQAPCIAPGTHPGHGTHAVFPIDMRNASRDPEKRDKMNRQGVGVGSENDPAPTVSCAHVNAVAAVSCETGMCTAFSSKDDGRDASVEISPTLRSGNHDKSHANSGAPPAVVIPEGMPPVAFQASGDRSDPSISVNEECAYTIPANPMSDRGQAVAFKSSHYTRDKDGAPSEVCPPLTKEADKGDQDPLILTEDVKQVQWASGGGKLENDTAQSLRADAEHNYQFVRNRYQVRRLTPIECERLQGFPDDYTRIPWRKKLAEDCPDGPRYKALGNSMAVTVMAWIGCRIDSFLKAEQE